jgi:hypothetical protein
MALERVEVADAGRLGNWGEQANIRQREPVARLLAALTGEETQDVGGGERANAIALDPADPCPAVPVREAREAHAASLSDGEPEWSNVRM